MAYFGENCSEHGLPAPDGVEVTRVEHRLADGRRISALRWGSESPEVVLVHGGAQNAHTWDTVALALRGTSLLAVDLPGHGRSSWRGDRRYDTTAGAEDLAEAVATLAPGARSVVGMSLGGLTSIALTRVADVVEHLVLVDITPGVDAHKAAEVHAFIAGPQTFPDFAEIFARTVAFNPTRTPASLRRGILHNAHRTADGSWEWNYDRRPLTGTEGDDPTAELGVGVLWDDLSATPASILLLRGGASPVVDDDDVAELLRRRPDARVVVVEGSGHSIQGDRPIELAALLRDELGL
ncbi:MAG: alpha/beta hydrolase [Actinobacteria bacterium]|nr:alpha/beta hydrolase [Actinomycetota bacterium]